MKDIRRKFISWSFIALSLTSIYAEEIPEIANGDLIFQVEGKSDFSKAIAASTAYGDSIKVIHVGILERKPEGKINVIEASPEEGVRIMPLKDFLEESPVIFGKPGVIVKRVNTPFPKESSVNRAKSHLGEDYDWNFLPNNGKMYCSELIYDSYLYENGERIFDLKPMNFLDSDGTMPDFWIELFGKLNQEVPQGVEGSNPNDLFKDPLLIEVKRYF
ncbi:MAG: hypothetical protein J1F16_10095 [Muribaculaceae bacterium]|nr:hypothetical protein [Muribaculaceae bacterium]